MAAGTAVLDVCAVEEALGAASTRVLGVAKRNGLMVERQPGIFLRFDGVDSQT